MGINLTDQDKLTLRTAAYGAVSLMAAAGAAGSPHKVATQGSIALASATGPIGYVLAESSKIKGLDGRSVAEIADHVLPALTAAMNLLRAQDPAEAVQLPRHRSRRRGSRHPGTQGRARSRHGRDDPQDHRSPRHRLIPRSTGRPGHPRISGSRSRRPPPRRWPETPPRPRAPT